MRRAAGSRRAASCFRSSRIFRFALRILAKAPGFTAAALPVEHRDKTILVGPLPRFVDAGLVLGAALGQLLNSVIVDFARFDPRTSPG